MEKYSTARQATVDNIVSRMRFARWIIKATGHTHTHRICNKYFFYIAAMVTECALGLRYTYIALPFHNEI